MDQLIKDQLIAECNTLHNLLIQKLNHGAGAIHFHQLDTMLQMIQTEFKNFEIVFITKLKMDSNSVFKKEVHAYTLKCAKKCLSALSSYE